MLMSAAFLVSALAQFGLGLLVAALLGPSEFGLYALGFAAAVLGQTLLFEWIRLSITRFSGVQNADAGQPDLAQLRPVFAAALLFCLAIAGLGLAFGGEQRWLIGIVILGVAILGHAESLSATLRARFAERRYAGFLLLRGLASVILVSAAILLVPRADVALATLFAAILIATVLQTLLTGSQSIWPDTRADAKRKDQAGLQLFVGYALPIVATNLAYLLLFFGLRFHVAASMGLASSGQFSLALDIGLKLVMTLGTAMDLVLFQLAVRAQDQHGPDAGRQRLDLNLALVLSLLAPVVLGAWLILPSLEILLVAPAFRGLFANQFALLLPGLFLYALVQYALHPLHQLAMLTRPLIIAAGFALLMTATIIVSGDLLRIPPESQPAAGLFAGMLLAAILVWPQSGQRPSIGGWRFLAGLAGALAALTVAAAPLRQTLPPGLSTGLATAFTGALAYALVIWMTDLAGLKSWVQAARRARSGR